MTEKAIGDRFPLPAKKAEWRHSPCRGMPW